MLAINEKGKVRISWKVTPYDYSKEREKEIITLFSKKYGLDKGNVSVVPEFIIINSDGNEESITERVIDNIQDPIFQQELFRKYIESNNIENCDYETILSIDRDINGKIDYQVYDKYRKFSIKWVKWSNFQSYGTDNYFDFTTLDGLVLLNGEPANQSGKTTFAVDLLRFLLFGKSSKAKVQEDIFNKYLQDETNVIVEGCLTIEGDDYIIRRTLSRPKKSSRTAKSKTTQKVDYYKIVGDGVEELEDVIEIEQGEDSRSTNRIIKESIGREEDFDLIMCITGSNLDSLINEKPTDRGRLFSRWIGLLPLEEKDALAREKYNGTIKPSLLSNQFNREQLRQEIEAYKVEIERMKKEGKERKTEDKKISGEIEKLEQVYKTLVESKVSIDEDVLKIDISTLRKSIEVKVQDGKEKTAQLERLTREISEIGEVDFSVEEYDRLNEERTDYLLNQRERKTEAANLMSLIRQLKSSEYCPTCGRKLDNVDNSKQINEHQERLDRIIEEGKKVKLLIDDSEKRIASMKASREMYNKLNSLKSQKPALELNIERLRGEYKELVEREREYKKNSDAIDKNNSVNMSIRNTEAEIKAKRSEKESNMNKMLEFKNLILQYQNEVERRNEIIGKIDAEEKLVYNWKVYLDMVGKNGISKMVMRKTLPIINARLSQLLDGVCDFNISVDINNKNEVTFNIVKDGVVSDINSGSGFERTAAALALRSVLADISTIPALNFIVLDEVLSRVSFDNYENIFKLISKALKPYDFAFLITHVDAVKEYADHTVTIVKEGNVSKIAKRL